MNKLLRKIILSICLIALIFTSMNTVARAESPSVSKCMEEGVDCPDTEETPASDKSENGKESADGISTGSLIFNLIKMVFALLLVLGLIYLLLKFLNKRNRLFQQVKALENLGGISVGPNKSIQLVRIGSKVFAVGVGDNVELLQEITDEEVKKGTIDKKSEETQQKSIAAALFQQGSNSNEEAESKQNFKNMFAAELEKLKQSRSKLINKHRQKEDKNE